MLATTHALLGLVNRAPQVDALNLASLTAWACVHARCAAAPAIPVPALPVACTLSIEVGQLQDSLSGPTQTVLLRLVSLFGMFTVLRDLGDFLEDGYLAGPMAAGLRGEFYQATPKFKSIMMRARMGCLGPVRKKI